ncbi:RNA polymerase factor sigma-54 [Paenibacillus dokdonensis]|uniref:RNA polymerase factor sigma-54 n=1 Tax=Paenibacillus dokdonensis TaxID=2567944 RepID=A0ABU6GUN9_9BACL|nr:RNA polymerase factor sigma-54 [Paenibacillus dokdonensis]MEC0242847.1 RNA polymerase factor sigma-54 [Paenibacillus dokdonensis]
MLGYQLVQDQRLKLAITPELKQSIHILTLSGYELVQYLQEQATENPVLELEDSRDIYIYSRKTRTSEEKHLMQDPFWNVNKAQETMEARLKSQLRLLSLPPEVYRTAAYMAGNLNDDGYLDITLADIRAELNISEALLELALEKLQSLEPAGIAGRNLRECLLLQIIRDPDAASYAYEIVDEYLAELADGKLGRMVSALRISREQVMIAYKYIRSLNPRPGLSIGAFEQHFIVPDAIVESHADGFTVSVHTSGAPKLSISHECGEWVKLRQSPEASSYLNHSVKSAQWIIRCIEMRKQTLMKVVYAMMEEQREFLEEGVRGLRPMTLHTISSKLDMHESTISRAVHDKFVRTPYGVFPLKYFFAAGLPTSSGGTASSQKVKARIKELIDSENKNSPYSDQKIVDVLFSEGVRLSRRTVTKYREELKILSSSSRRRKI